MKIKILSDVCTICENKNSLHNYFAWPSIARLPDGALAMVCSGFRLAHLCPFGKAVICYSRDDGRTWARPAPIIDTPLDDRDAGIAVNADGSVVILTSFNNSIKAQHEYSSLANRPESQNKYVDAYLNCLDSRKIERDFLGSTFVLSNDGGYTFGDIMKAPISCPHGPAVLPDGSFLYVGRCFTDDEASSHIQCFKISKTGQMQFVSTIENPSDFEGVVSCEPTAICLPAGKIVVHIRVQRSASAGKPGIFTLYQSESEDGGNTFTKPHRIIGERSGAPAHLLLHSSGVLLSVYGHRENPFGIRVIASRDYGKSWSAECVLFAQGINADIGYPCSVERTDGSILTVFYTHDTENSPAVIKQLIWRLEE